MFPVIVIGGIIAALVYRANQSNSAKVKARDAMLAAEKKAAATAAKAAAARKEALAREQEAASRKQIQDGLSPTRRGKGFVKGDESEGNL